MRMSIKTFAEPIPIPLELLIKLANGVQYFNEMWAQKSLDKLKERGYIDQSSNGIYYITKKGIDTLCDLGLIS